MNDRELRDHVMNVHQWKLAMTPAEARKLHCSECSCVIQK